MDEFQEILQDFLVESFELIEQLDQDLVELESRPDDLELLNGIFRVAHTIKGASSFLNFDVLTHLTHHMEDVLNKARHGELSITADVMDVILESIDLMKTLLVKIRDTSEDSGVEVEDCVRRLDQVSSGGGVDAPVIKEAPIQEETKEEVAEEVAQLEEEAEAEDEIDYENLSEAEIEAEIERLLAKRQAEDKAKREAKQNAGESVPTPPPAPKEEAKEVAAGKT
jgi:Chemotaxis protein histidine kinase and related kinases